MKKFNFGLLSVFAIALSVAFLSSCGKDEEEDKTYTEADYVGTYYGKHALDNAILLEIIKGIDPTGDGTFADTITVTSGTDPNDNKLIFTSALLSNTSIEADISKSVGNVTQIKIDSLLLSDSAGVYVKNVTVRSSSTVKAKGGNTLNVDFKLAGSVFQNGTQLGPTLPNLPTTGVFTK